MLNTNGKGLQAAYIISISSKFFFLDLILLLLVVVCMSTTITIASSDFLAELQSNPASHVGGQFGLPAGYVPRGFGCTSNNY